MSKAAFDMFTQCLALITYTLALIAAKILRMLLHFLKVQSL